MLQFIRTRSKFLLWALVIIVVVTFSLWGTYSMHEGLAPMPKAGQISGRTVLLPEFESAAREVAAMYSLNTGRLQTKNDLPASMLQREAWDRLLILDAAQKYGVAITDAEVAKNLKELPIFADDKGQFDAARYKNFVQAACPALGLTEDRFHELIRHELAIGRTVSLITVGAAISDEAVKKQFQQQNADATVWTLAFPTKNHAPKANPTQEEIAKHYESRKARYSTPEKRKVLVAKFSLPADKAKLPEADKAKALETLGAEAVAFSVDLLDESGRPKPDFRQVAGQRQVAVAESPLFSADKPAPDFAGKDSLVRAAFSLSQIQPDSDVIQEKDDFFVLRLVETRPPEPVPLDQVRDKIVAEISAAASREAAQQAASKARDILREELKKGAKFDAASKAAGSLWASSTVKPSDKNKNSKSPMLAAVCTSLATGEVSDPIPLDDAPTIIYVEKRDPAPETPEALEQIRNRLLGRQRETVYREWLAHTMRAKDTAFFIGQGQAE